MENYFFLNNRYVFEYAVTQVLFFYDRFFLFQDMPCENNGTCIDGINEYQCDCTDTGFEGDHCEINIDECALFEDPCQNNATCVDLINAYECQCYPGYDGQNCENDIPECEVNPCENGLCFERSNLQYYNEVDTLPEEIKAFFEEPFRFDAADGYVCKCNAGYEGKTKKTCGSIGCKNLIESF